MTAIPAGWPDELALLAGPGAGALLAGAVGDLGGRLESWQARQVSHQPGASTVARYHAGVRWADGRRRAQTLVAETGPPDPPHGATTAASAGGGGVTVWLWPHDPALPGLAPALDRRRIAALLRDLGVAPSGRPELSVRSYRPGRRAVVEVTTRAGDRLFLKVVRPGRAAGIHRRHRLLAEHVPVPRSLGWTAEGILVLAGLRGSTLRERLRAPAPAPPVHELFALLDRLPAELTEMGPARRPLDRVAHDAGVLAATVPAVAERALDVAGRLAAARAAGAPMPTAPVHGDLHDAQLVVDDGGFAGILDVDGAGAGARADDLANALAHLSVLAERHRDRPGIARYAADLRAAAEAAHGAETIRPRVAASVLALATGPFRVQEPDWAGETDRRLALADRWLGAVSEARNGP